MSLDTDLIARLGSVVGAGIPVQQNYASVDRTEPRVYVQRQAGDVDLLVAGDAIEMTTTVFAVEVAGLDPDATAAVADAIKALSAASGMHGLRGLLNGVGSTRVLGCFVEDQSDDYQPRGLDDDTGYHIFAMQLRILT